MGEGACGPQEESATIFLCSHFSRTGYSYRLDLIHQDRASAQGEKYQIQILYEKTVTWRNTWLLGWVSWPIVQTEFIIYPLWFSFSLGWGKGAGVGIRGSWNQATNYNIKKCNSVKSVSQLVILQISSWLTKLNLFWMLAGIGPGACDCRCGLAAPRPTPPPPPELLNEVHIFFVLLRVSFLII